MDNLRIAGYPLSAIGSTQGTGHQARHVVPDAHAQDP